MNVTIDKAGRIVVPKPLRDAMGLEPGTELQVDYIDGRLVIEYAPLDVEVRDEGGFPVLHLKGDREAPVLTDDTVRDTLEAVRDERIARYL
ncbi:MAG: AbrB/MazE/SpoVT family DNA-binding domain-containing protein [Leucobacter sp.]